MPNQLTDRITKMIQMGTDSLSKQFGLDEANKTLLKETFKSLAIRSIESYKKSTMTESDAQYRDLINELSKIKNT
jgi:hypothetical protein